MLRDRDYVALKATMDELDAEEVAVRATVEAPITPTDVAEALSDMRRLFGKAETQAQQRIAQALFEHVEVLGPLHVWVHPSDEAVAQGWSTAMHGEFEREVRRYGRGERGSATLAHLRFRPRFVLEHVTRPPRAWPAAYRKAG